MSKKSKIIIIRAVFGRLEMVIRLRNKPMTVLLVGQNNYHNFQPLMYEVTKGDLELGNIAFLIRQIFRTHKSIIISFEDQGGISPLIPTFTHMLSLVEFRVKMATFIEWITNYLSYNWPQLLVLKPTELAIETTKKETNKTEGK